MKSKRAKKKAKARRRLIRKVCGIAGLAYAGLFAVYYYDLDGKLIYYVVEPFLDKHYSAMERPDMTKTPYGAKESVSVEVDNYGSAFGAGTSGTAAGSGSTGRYGEPKPKNVKVTM